MSEKKKDALAQFRCLGVEFVETGSGNSKGHCPFCGKNDHFFVNEEDGRYHCKICGAAGNAYIFMETYTAHLHQKTTTKDWAKLAHLRGVPAEAFKASGMAWCENKEEWLIPIKSEKNTVRDVRRWNFRRTMSTEGCHLQLFGLWELFNAAKGGTVWICEGEWDTMVLRWFLNATSRKADIVVGVPGAGTFKADWINYFKGQHVRLCYDNDDAGDMGARKAAHLLEGVAASILFLCWPETLPPGYDLRDCIVSGIGKEISAEDGLAAIELMLQRKHRHDREPALPPENGAPTSQNDKIATFAEVMKMFRKWVRVDQDLEDAIALSLAVCLSNDISGDPIWLQLVAPPGSGKTMVLMALQHSERVVFKSTLTPASLVSGFNVHPDPSLLPQLDGKCAVFKDGTELLALHPDAKSQVYGVLRGAFDGHVNKSFGNGVSRDYVLHFNMLMGITPAVHADNHASVGERFLRFEMKEDKKTAELKIRAAIQNIAKEVAMEKELSEVCRRFLLQTVNQEVLPEIDTAYVEQIIALAQITSMLRAQVDRENYGDRDVKYRPSYESGTRLGKQMSKLANLLCIVYGKKQMDEKVYRLIQRVSSDTSIGFHLDIVKKMMRYEEEGYHRDQIAEMIKLPLSTLTRKVQDLEQLGVMRKYRDVIDEGKRGPVPYRWRLTSEISKLWHRAALANGTALERFTGRSPKAGVGRSEKNA